MDPAKRRSPAPLGSSGSRRGAFYVLLAQYRLERTVSVVLSRKSTARRKRLAENVEAIIAATLREKWMVLEAPPLAPVVDEIRARCEAAGLRPPSYVTVRSRAAALFCAGGNRQAALRQSEPSAAAQAAARLYQRAAGRSP